MNFAALEDQIVAYLQTKIISADVTIIPLPEDNVEMQPPFGKLQIVVAFAGEDADPDNNTSVVVQETTIVFSVLLQGKKLRGDKGLYPLAELVKNVLMGFKPTDCRELTYSSHKFVQNDQKIFEYVLDFKTTSTRVQDVTEETGPAFKSATFIEQQ